MRRTGRGEFEFEFLLLCWGLATRGLRWCGGTAGVLRTDSPTPLYRSRGESGVYVLDPSTSECLHYEPVVGYPPKSHVSIPREVLAEHSEVEIRNDFIDCSIDICSVEASKLSSASRALH